CANGFNGLDSW
nr:immunoglobulin heavy chain junction region [Macaca mulatta]MOY21769.1 immunoglobulin heavy chain junction region [Macaca mulatta]MOY21900.1 immunoglobulin heavy chain junction region [Macaca mulatta]MOY21902.1 immunoglobulin heavy chain junction region [Macaca mulatta]MOY21937.1 immunoglobulin heavy chain junction region [Macaca mulatta]